MEFLISIITFISSLLSSFAGGGFSMFMMSILLTLFPGWLYIQAITVAKLGAASMTIISVYIHKKHQGFDTMLVLVLTLGSLIGTAIGTYLMQFVLSKDTMQTMLAMFLVLSAIYLALSKKQGLVSVFVSPTRQQLLFSLCFAIVLNILNGIFGGTGTKLQYLNGNLWVKYAALSVMIVLAGKMLFVV